MIKYRYKIRCLQIVEELSDVDDQEALPAGDKGIFSHMDYHFIATTDGGALDIFHDNIPIGCVDDFIVEIQDKRPLLKRSGCVSIW